MVFFQLPARVKQGQTDLWDIEVSMTAPVLKWSVIGWPLTQKRPIHICVKMPISLLIIGLGWLSVHPLKTSFIDDILEVDFLSVIILPIYSQFSKLSIPFCRLFSSLKYSPCFHYSILIHSSSQFNLCTGVLIWSFWPEVQSSCFIDWY